MDQSIQQLVAVAEDIKRLLIAILIRSGATQSEVAKALGVSQATVSRLFPAAANQPKVKRKK